MRKMWRQDCLDFVIVIGAVVLNDLRNTSEYVFSLGSGVFSCASKKQQTVAQPTGEAEHISTSLTTSQAIWLRRILEDFGEK